MRNSLGSERSEPTEARSGIRQFKLLERQWNAEHLGLLMSGERLLASYILRVTVKGGQRVYQLHDLSRGTTDQVRSYEELFALLDSADSGQPDESTLGQQR